jgi:hypothetical protein
MKQCSDSMSRFFPAMTVPQTEHRCRGTGAAPSKNVSADGMRDKRLMVCVVEEV